MSASTITTAAPAAKGRRLASVRARIAGHWFLAVPALAYLCLALPMAALTKPWTNNDEPSHVAYIQYLLAHHAFPQLNLDNGVEAHQPPLYYLLGAVWQHIAGVRAFAVPEVFVSEGRAVPRQYSAASHEADWTVYWLRGLSVGLGLAVVIAATVAAALIFQRRRALVLAGGLTVALWPKFLVVATSVTNDILVDALCAWFFVGVVVLMKRGRPASRRDWIVVFGTGVVGGLAVLSKFTAIPLVVLGVLILAAGIAADRRSWPNLLAVSGAAALTCSWWLIRNAHHYGDLLATHATERYLKNVFHGALVHHVSFFSDPQRFVHMRWPSLRRSVLYDGGWNQLHLPHWLDTLFWWAVAVVLVALVIGLIVNRPAWPDLRVTIVMAVAGPIAWLQIAQRTTQGEGRYLFVSIVPIALLLLVPASWLAQRAGRAMNMVAVGAWPVAFAAVDGYVFAKYVI